MQYLGEPFLQCLYRKPPEAAPQPYGMLTSLPFNSRGFVDTACHEKPEFFTKLSRSLKVHAAFSYKLHLTLLYTPPAAIIRQHHAVKLQAQWHS